MSSVDPLGGSWRTFTEKLTSEKRQQEILLGCREDALPANGAPGSQLTCADWRAQVYASVAESLDEKVEKRTHLGHAMPTLRASSSSSAEGALNTVYEIEGALENDGLVIRGLHEAVLPPLTPSIWPVTNEALSDAR